MRCFVSSCVMFVVGMWCVKCVSCGVLGWAGCPGAGLMGLAGRTIKSTPATPQHSTRCNRSDTDTQNHSIKSPQNNITQDAIDARIAAIRDTMKEMDSAFDKEKVHQLLLLLSWPSTPASATGYRMYRSILARTPQTTYKQLSNQNRQAEERIASLAGGVARIRVGAATEVN